MYILYCTVLYSYDSLSGLSSGYTYLPKLGPEQYTQFMTLCMAIDIDPRLHTIQSQPPQTVRVHIDLVGRWVDR